MCADVDSCLLTPFLRAENIPIPLPDLAFLVLGDGDFMLQSSIFSLGIFLYRALTAEPRRIAGKKSDSATLKHYLPAIMLGLLQNEYSFASLRIKRIRSPVAPDSDTCDLPRQLSLADVESPVKATHSFIE